MKYQPSVNVNPPAKQEIGVKAFLKEISNKNKPIEQPEVEEVKEAQTEDIPRNPMLGVVAFLETLTNRCEDGRVVCSKQSIIGKGTLKFLLLNPSSHFKDIVSETRAVQKL